MIFVMAVISATIIIIWILSKQGVIPGLWSTILSNSLAVLAVTVLITHMLIVRHYSHQQLVAGSFERREEIGLPKRGRGLFYFLSCVFISIALAPFVWFGPVIIPYVFPYPCTPSPSPSSKGIGVIKVKVLNSECIGVSDGSFAFDTNRADGALKQQAAEKFVAGNPDGAESIWRDAVEEDTNDAEALIYRESERVRESGSPYITLVIGTILTGDTRAVSIGRDNLQGAYVAQKEYNDRAKTRGGTQIRLLIANTGSDPLYATKVAEQIVKVASTDPTLVGVMGWPFSYQSINANAVLVGAKIPIVSPTSSNDSLTGSSLYLFRVTPSNKSQASVAVEYARQRLRAKKVALFVDPGDEYSKDVANDFSDLLKAQGGTIITEQYSSDSLDKLPDLLHDALGYHPDLIYFSGYGDALTVLMADLPTNAQVQVMGGDPFDEMSKLFSKTIHYDRLHFTVFASPDEWAWLAGGQIPAFFNDYKQNFDPYGRHIRDPEGYTHADGNVMLSYDAMLTLLKGCDIALSQNLKFTPEDLQQALTTISYKQKVQGVSGRILFGPDHDPVDKIVIVVHFDKNGYLQMDAAQGNFF